MGTLLVVIAAICAGLAVSQAPATSAAFSIADQPPARRHQGQSDHSPDQVEAVRDTAAFDPAGALGAAPSRPRAGACRNRNVQVGLVLTGNIAGLGDGPAACSSRGERRSDVRAGGPSRPIICC